MAEIYHILLAGNAVPERLEETMAIAVIATWEPKPDTAREVEELLLELREGSRAEAGCLQYDVHRTEDSTFILYERWADLGAIEEHHATPHYQDLVKGRAPELLERREFTRCELL
jgi:quinol monooxygenase YgiN